MPNKQLMASGSFTPAVKAALLFKWDLSIHIPELVSVELLIKEYKNGSTDNSGSGHHRGLGHFFSFLLQCKLLWPGPFTWFDASVGPPLRMLEEQPQRPLPISLFSRPHCLPRTPN